MTPRQGRRIQRRGARQHNKGAGGRGRAGRVAEQPPRKRTGDAAAANSQLAQAGAATHGKVRGAAIGGCDPGAGYGSEGRGAAVDTCWCARGEGRRAKGAGKRSLQLSAPRPWPPRAGRAGPGGRRAGHGPGRVFRLRAFDSCAC